MSELAVRHLIAHGATSLLIANRTESARQKIAAHFTHPGVSVEVIPFEALYAQADRADIVITSTGADQQIFGRANGQHFIQRRRGRPMFFIDIAVPRDVDPRMNNVEGCFVYDIDDLQQVAASQPHRPHPRSRRTPSRSSPARSTATTSACARSSTSPPSSPSRPPPSRPANPSSPAAPKPSPRSPPSSRPPSKPSPAP